MPHDLAEALRWLAYAMEDLEHGKLGAPSFPRSAAWSFQQAAEKALKALILVSGEPVPKVHDLAYLLQVLERKFSHGGELLEAAMALSEISTASRYPADMVEITVKDCAEFQQAAETVVTWCKFQLDHWPTNEAGG